MATTSYNQMLSYLKSWPLDKIADSRYYLKHHVLRTLLELSPHHIRKAFFDASIRQSIPKPINHL